MNTKLHKWLKSTIGYVLLAISRERMHSVSVMLFSVHYLVNPMDIQNSSGTIYKGMLVKNKLSSQAMIASLCLVLGSPRSVEDFAHNVQPIFLI